MARVPMTISLPDGLKDRMGQFEGINWSGVCRNAIEGELRMQEALANGDRMQRLKAKKRQSEGEDFDRGHSDAIGYDDESLDWKDLVAAENISRLEAERGLDDEKFDRYVSDAFLTEYGQDVFSLFEDEASVAYRRGFVAGLAELKARVDAA